MTKANSPNCGRWWPRQTHQTVAADDQGKLTKLWPLMTKANSPNCGHWWPRQTHQTVAVDDQGKPTKLWPLMTKANPPNCGHWWPRQTHQTVAIDDQGKLTKLWLLMTRANSPNCGHWWPEQTLQTPQHPHWSGQQRWPHCRWSVHCWLHGQPYWSSWRPAPHPETDAAVFPHPPRTRRPRWRALPSRPSAVGRKSQCWWPFLDTINKGWYGSCKPIDKMLIERSKANSSQIMNSG